MQKSTGGLIPKAEDDMDEMIEYPIPAPSEGVVLDGDWISALGDKAENKTEE